MASRFEDRPLPTSPAIAALGQQIADSDAASVRPPDPLEALREARTSRRILTHLAYLVLVMGCGAGGALAHSTLGVGICVGLFALLMWRFSVAARRDAQKRRDLMAARAAEAAR